MEEKSSFSGYSRIAKDYDKGRPDYPQDILPIFIPALRLCPGNRMVDLGAGTGKLTKAILPTGADIVAIEPVAEMRKVFAASFPGIPVHEGHGEDIPLESSSADSVAVGTAFHWFATDKALAEIHRILKPRGRLGLIWNGRNNEVGWMRKLCLLEEKYGERKREDKVKWADVFKYTNLFTPLNHHAFEYVCEGSSEEILNRLFSAKIMGTLKKPEKESLQSEVLDLLETDPETKGKKRYGIPFRIDMYWCEKIS